ncbi:hypothetical protein [Gandjariella thermophila]|uniref:Uncharacterized protein n=1 Tax=Gandjariella thermophila TaxID=1931992 RepID=A0A4D4J222_9PSEU|nr:hypothetical protein [Gandjariella thermophila]GDY28828.1 hypothetical protein GTS_04610 [Gandjariella thermophila]
MIDVHPAWHLVATLLGIFALPAYWAGEAVVRRVARSATCAVWRSRLVRRRRAVP